MQKILLIPDASFETSAMNSPWGVLARYAHVTVADPLGDLAALSPSDVRAWPLAQLSKHGNFDYVVGHGRALRWLPLFRLSGCTVRFAVVPDVNPTRAGDLFALGLAAQLAQPGDCLAVGCRAAARPFSAFGFRALPIYPLGIPTAVFFPRHDLGIRQRLGMNDGERLILYAGRLEEDKGVHTLLEIFDQLPHTWLARLVICHHIAEAAYRTECMRRAARMERVRFLEQPTIRELASVYGAADLFVMPSLSRYETFGRAPLEAMACGAVPVLPDYNGFRDTITEDTGVLVPTLMGEDGERRCNEQQFARRIEQLFCDRQRLLQLRTNGMQHARQFDTAQTMAAFCVELERSARELPLEPAPRHERFRLAALPFAARPLFSSLEGADIVELAVDLLLSNAHRLEDSATNWHAFKQDWFSGYH